MGTSTTVSRDPPPDQVQGDVNAVFQGMTDSVIDRQQRQRQQAAPPPSLQPGYTPPMPSAITPQPQQSQAPWARPQLPPQPQTPPVPQQVATAAPVPRFQLGSQPGPWPQAYPNSPRYDPATAPALPGETPDETAALNRFMAHETGSRGNIINDWAAKNPELYTKEGRTCQGYWQIVNSTWRDGAQKAGVDLRQYPTAMTAPYPVQRQVALALYRSYGDKPWKAQPGAGEQGDRFQLASQTMVMPEQRGAQDWGHPPPMMGSPQPGAMPQQSEFGRILNAISPLLLGIGSLALRLPLSTAVSAYSAMARAQFNGQQIEYERQRTQWQDKFKESTDQQALESRDASDAFSEYGTNNPQGLQQALAGIALKYNDPVMLRMAERGDLNGIYAMQAKRDMYNQALQKVSKAAEDVQDRQATDAAVTAMDHQWHDQFVKDNGREPTADEAAIAHNQHIGEAGRAGTKDPKAEGTKEEAQPYEVLDKTTNQPTRQVRLGQNGGMFDLDGKPTQLGPNERLGGKVGGGGEEKPAQEKTAIELAGARARTDEWAKAQNPPVQPDSNAYKAHLAEEVQKATEAKPAAEGPKPSDYKDYTWDDSQGKHHGPSSAALVPGQGLVDPNGKPIDAKPETIRTVSSATSSPSEGYSHEAGQGDYTDKPNRPPPGTDITDGEWAQALTYVNTGKAPTFARDRQAMARFREIVPVAMRAMNVTDDQMNRRWVEYAAYKTREQRIEAAFAGGQDGKTLIALNTVAHHIDLFRQYAAAMRAHDEPAMNAVIDNLARQGGAPELMDFNIVSRVTGDELVRVLTGTGGGTITDREDIAHQLSAYSSPEQFEGVANTLTNVLRGRFGPLQRAYAWGDPAKEKFFQDNMMEPEARRMFQGEQRPIAGAGVQPLTEQQYNAAPSGTRYRMPNDPPGTVRVKP